MVKLKWDMAKVSGGVSRGVVSTPARAQPRSGQFRRSGLGGAFIHRGEDHWGEHLCMKNHPKLSPHLFHQLLTSITHPPPSQNYSCSHQHRFPSPLKSPLSKIRKEAINSSYDIINFLRCSVGRGGGLNKTGKGAGRE